MSCLSRLRPSGPAAVAPLALSVAVLLAACGGGGGAAAPAPTPTPTGQMPAFTVPVSQAVAVSGTVNLVIVNTGGDVTGCSVAANSPAQLPAGLMVEAFTSSGKRTCRVFGDVGASVAPGSYMVAISGASAVGAATVMVTFVVSAGTAPALADVAGVRELRLGERASVVFKNNGGGATACAAAPGSTALPTGLSFGVAAVQGGAATCELSGVPGAEVAQAVTLTVRAANAGGMDDATVMVTVVPEAPALGDIVAVQELTLGAAASVAFPNTGGAVTGCAAAPGSTALPSALTFELHTPASGAASCALVGMPDAEVAQAVTLTVRAANAGGMDDATVMVTVRVAPPDLQNIVNRVPLALDQAQSVPFPNEGGAATGCAAAPGGAALPSGMAFELHTPASGPASCALAGTPDVEAAAAVTLTVRASNSAGDSDATVSVTVVPEAPALGDVADPVVLTAGVEAEAVAFGNSGGAVRAAGGCALAQGVSLPKGLSLARAEPAGGTATCEISGTPDAAAGAVAAATYTIVASNAGGSVMATVTIEVVEPATVAPDLADLSGTRTLTIGLRIQPLTFVNSGGAVQATGGCSVTAGELPMGLSLARAEPAGGTATCEISGAPAGPAAAAAEVTVTGANAVGTDTASVTIAVEAAVVATMAPDLQDATPPALTAGERASVEVANSGGAVATCSEQGLPGGLTVEPGAPARGGAATCVITGSPAAPTTAPVAATVTGANAVGSDTATITITVNPPAPDIIDIVGVQERAPGGEIAPIAFSNSGGGAAQCAVPAGSPALPPALAVRTAAVAGRESCEIHGVPSAPAAEAEYTIEASNDGGADTATVTILVAFPAPVLLDIDAPQRLALGKVVTGISFTSTGGDVAAEGCSLAAVAGQSVPMGLGATDVDGESGKPRTCAITGTPMEVVESAVTLVVTATGEGGATDEATIMVTVLPDPPALVSIPGTRDLTVNVVIAPIRFDNDGGRVEDMGCSLAAEGGAAAPPGLSAEVVRGSGGAPDSCRIVGTPTMVAETAVTLTVTATNEGGGMDTATVSVRVLPLAPVLADFEGTQRLTLGEAVSGVVFRNTGGGVEEMGCSLAAISGGMVPLGLRAEVVAGTGGADTCRLAGIPTVEVATPLELTVTGANGAVSDTATVTITVLPLAPVLGDVTGMRELIVNQAISSPIPFTNTGGDVRTAGCSFAAGSAQEPRGLSAVHVPAAGVSKATCALGGTPMALTTGAVSLEITGVNSGGSDTGSITVLVVEEATAPVLEALDPVQLQTRVSLLDPIVFTNTGGGDLNPDTASTKGCVVAPDLPDGLEVERTRDGNSCQITGEPSVASARREYLVTATNSEGSASISISLLIAPSALSLALDTHILVGYRGLGPWDFSVAQTTDGVDALSSPAGITGRDRACVDVEFSLPGRYRFNWMSRAQSGGGLYLFTEENGAPRRLAATGAWETETGELALGPGAGASSREGVLAWCQGGGGVSKAGAAHLDQVSYVEAPVGLVASPSSSTSVDLVWDEYPGATHYMVEQGANADGTGAVAVTTGSGQTTNTFSIDSLTAGAALYFWVSACDGNGCTARSLAASATPRVADSDGDGLLDVHSLADLAAMRNSLDGSVLRHSGLLAGSSEGCPLAGCGGYELMGALDFDADGQSDGAWGIGADGEPYADPGDLRREWGRTVDGGWEPVGNCGADRLCNDDLGTPGDEELDNAPFSAIFDGGGHSITGLASVRDEGAIGLFGLVGAEAQIRNVVMEEGMVARAGVYFRKRADIGGLAGYVDGGGISGVRVQARALGSGDRNDGSIGGLAGTLEGGFILNSRATGDVSSNAYQVGGLVGRQMGGYISASSATGDVGGGNRRQVVGGLVGYQWSGDIAASYATGAVVGGEGKDSVGGLVGQQYALGGVYADVVACYASGAVSGGGGEDNVGGLVGYQLQGNVVASYAIGDVDAGLGEREYAGGVVGLIWFGSIRASYATGAVDGGLGGADVVGSLAGASTFGSVVSSWGIGEVSRGSVGVAGSGAMPARFGGLTGLNAGNAPVVWSHPGQPSLGAWDYGTEAQDPALMYADYDGTGAAYHCANSLVAVPQGAVLVPECSALSILPGQRRPRDPGNINVRLKAIDTAVLEWGGGNAVSFEVWRGTGSDVAMATKLTEADGDELSFENDGLSAGVTYHYWVVSCDEQGCARPFGAAGAIVTTRMADADDDGLIEIGSPLELHNIRYGLDGSVYREFAGNGGNRLGCPEMGGCTGYELGAEIDFDGSDADGTTWAAGGEGGYTLDADDSHPVYFDTANGGWLPIGDCGDNRACLDDVFTDGIDESADNRPFTGTFDGGGHAILGLATTRSSGVAGLFGLIGSGAEIRNVDLRGGLVAPLAQGAAGGLAGHMRGGSVSSSRSSGEVSGYALRLGGLVGTVSGGTITSSRATGVVASVMVPVGSGFQPRARQSGGLVGGLDDGRIVASHATGDVTGSQRGEDAVGGLVGAVGAMGPTDRSPAIYASYATGRVSGGGSGSDRLGGLVGRIDAGSVFTSYASGGVGDGVGGARFNEAGGLVGHVDGGGIRSSYATGEVNAGGGSGNLAGGLVGRFLGGAIKACYAIGRANGGMGRAGRLVGRFASGEIEASWGFGAATGANAGSDGSDDLPSGVMVARQLTFGANSATDAAAIWNQAGEFSLGAWDFGTSAQTPALNYADYDGAVMPAAPATPTSGHILHCANDAMNAPAGAILMPGCGETAQIPGQRAIFAPEATATLTSASAVRIDWGVVDNITRYEVVRATGGDGVGSATELTTPGTAHTTLMFANASLTADTTYRYWVRGCDADGCGPYSEAVVVSLRTVDADADGLIDVANARDLDRVRYNLAGTGLVDYAGGPVVAVGCPSNVCSGYELTDDIDFDGDDADGGTWVRNSDGSVTLDRDDHHPDYFDVDAGGWEPIGDCGSDGTCGNADDNAFAATFEGNGRSISNLAVSRGGGQVGLFGLIGDGAVVRNLELVGNLAHSTLVGVHSVMVGGLAGVQTGGDIIAGRSAGEASAYAFGARIGGLVGWLEDGAITASYASGRVSVLAGRGSAESTRTLAGGLVGDQDSEGAINASYAISVVSGSGALAHIGTYGGLVGAAAGGIAATYATGEVLGGHSASDVAGGLVGNLESGASLTASYSVGLVSGGGGGEGTAGSLLGQNAGVVADSYGFGGVLSYATAGSAGAPIPSMVKKAQDLTTGAAESANTNAPSTWNEASSGTAGAWDFGTVAQAPALKYADYDGAPGGMRFHCANAMNAPDGAALLPGCGATPPLLPGQRQTALAPPAATLAYSRVGSAMTPTVAIEWTAGASANGYRVYRGSSADAGQATEITDSSAAPPSALSFSDTGFSDGAAAYYWISSCSGNVCLALGEIAYAVLARIADGNSNGLIDLSTAGDLDLVRNDLAGTSLSLGGGLPASRFGCPEGGCFGYELLDDIDFDSDGDGSTWSGGSGSFGLDGGDHDPDYFDVRAGGWEPIGVGTGDESFNSLFEGHGRSISGLASIRSGGAGMFGGLGSDAVVRNLRLLKNLAVRTNPGVAGGLAGTNSGLIVASHTTGPVYAGGNGLSRLGGLVGSHVGGAIQSCFATGDVAYSRGGFTSAGGLVSDIQNGATITASYATGNVTGTASSNEGLGGLVGWMPTGTITASWASGDVNAGAGTGDFAGKVAGAMTGGTINDSWGFGAAIGSDGSAFDGSASLPSGVTAPHQLDAENVPDTWKQASSNTAGAWRFGIGHAPLVNYADYDGETMPAAPAPPTSGHRFHCASDAANAPAGAALIAGDCAMPSPIPGQPTFAPLAGLALSLTAADTVTISWDADASATGYEVWRGESVDPGAATKITADDFTMLTTTDGGRGDGVVYYYWVLACTGDGCLSLRGAPHISISVRAADGDGDGLIEIFDARGLDSMRRDLAGSRWLEFDAVSNAIGCPDGGCGGYELMADIDFDLDGDGSTWGGEDGVFTLDAGDWAPHFDVEGVGWEPVGTDSAPFTGVFEGNGRTISGLATITELRAGMFGNLSATAEVRNLGLVGNLAARSSDDTAGSAGGIAGESAGDITASWVTGAAYVAGDGNNSVGGLVGGQGTGAITACYATGVVGSGMGKFNRVGGLVGRLDSGSIVASYATGDVSASVATGERAGGLVGFMFDGAVTASWASGGVAGVDTTSGRYGALVGFKSSGSVTSSWGFGAVADGENTPEDSGADNKTLSGSAGRPVDAFVVAELSIGGSSMGTDVPDVWNAAASSTMGAWGVYGGVQAPVVHYADYDGSMDAYHCAGAGSAPDGAVIVANCGEPIPGQPFVPIVGLGAVMGSPTTATLSWRPSGRAGYHRVLRARSGVPLEGAVELTTGVSLTESVYALTGLSSGVVHRYWVVGCVGVGGSGVDDDECSAASQPLALAGRDADIDGDGLIEIGSAAELAIIANDLAGASYKGAAVGVGFDDGCPAGGCVGYELVADIEFDIDGDGRTWRRGSGGGLLLDRGDHQPAYFDVSSGGWAPVGDSTTAFTATFDGGYHTIGGLAVLDDAVSIGMFGNAGSGAVIRRLGLDGNLAASTGDSEVDIGGLVGNLDGGAVVACFATGEAVGPAAAVTDLGGLVGHVNGGSIVASSALGSVLNTGNSANGCNIGGLAGNIGGNAHIVASFASAEVHGGAGIEHYVGGLVGHQGGGSITASYATGDVEGGPGNGGRAGGLIGNQFAGSLTASYATGDADAGGNPVDDVGSLLGLGSEVAPVTSSWGFGSKTGGVRDIASNEGSSDRPSGASAAADLTFGSTPAVDTDVPAVWNAAASRTMGAWDFGDDTEEPALRFADYDGSGAVYHCDNEGSPPAGAILIPGCGSFLATQRVLAATTVISATALPEGGVRLVWRAVSDASFYRVFRSLGVRGDAVQVSVDDEQSGASFIDLGVAQTRTLPSYWVQACTPYACSVDAAAPAVDEGRLRRPVLDPVGLPGQAIHLYRYRIGREYPRERRIIILNLGREITGCTAASEDLPEGMAIDTHTCTITGSPIRMEAETTMHTVTATSAEGVGSVVIGIETYHLDPPIVRPYSAEAVTLVSGSGDGLPVVFANDGGAVEECEYNSDNKSSQFRPDKHNLAIGVSDEGECMLGLVSGQTSAKGLADGVTYSIRASNSRGPQFFNFGFSIEASATAPSALSVVGGESAFTFAANRAITPITFSSTGDGFCSIAPKESGGAPLPEGLAIEPLTCVISGTPREAVVQTAYTVSFVRGSSMAEAEVSIAVSDTGVPALPDSHSASLIVARPTGLPVVLPGTGGVPGACAASVPAGSGSQGPLSQYNLFIYPAEGGCAIDSIDGQGPTPATDAMPYTLSYEITALNTTGSSAASALTLAISPPRTIVATTSGTGQHTCAVNSAGKLYCWGFNTSSDDNDSQKLGLGRALESAIVSPAQVGHRADWISVDTATQFMCGIAGSDGQLYCWGGSANGNFGGGTKAVSSAVPVRVGVHTDDAAALATGWTQVSASNDTVCAIRGSEGHLYCWGSSSTLGLGADVDTALLPRRVGVHTDDAAALAANWVDVSVGPDTTCAIRGSEGHLYCWGKMLYGVLGTGATEDQHLPQRVGVHADDAEALAAGWTQVSAGAFSTCAIRERDLYCWGREDMHGLGVSSNTEVEPRPTLVHDTFEWAFVDVGSFRTCAVTVLGHLHCWDTDGERSRVGAGQPYATGWLSIYLPRTSLIENSGDRLTQCGVREVDAEQQLWCWGEGGAGQLGLGNFLDSDVPVQVPLPPD